MKKPVYQRASASFTPYVDLHSLRAAVAASPDNLPLRILFARACEEEFELDEARVQWNAALSLDKLVPEAHVGLVRLLDLEGKTSEAILRVEAFLAMNSSYGPAWLLGAKLALKDGNAQTAHRMYMDAVKRDSNQADPDLLDRIAKAGGRDTGTKRVKLTGSGSYAEEETWDEGDDDDEFEGIEGISSRESGIEFAPKGDVRFSDVGGMEEVKENIRMKIIYPIQKPELYKAYGKKAGGGVLMYGPPGCGKTLLARATAGEIDANFLSVGLHQVLDMFIGQSEQKLHQIFELARAHAPTVLFFDEVDALASDRRDMRQSAGRGLINQLLAEMDGTNGNNDGVLVLGATNAPWHLDAAFLRPGRFDKLVFVPPPDQVAREDIIAIHSREKPVEQLDMTALAKRTDQFSGADVQAVFDQAVEATMAEAMRKGVVIPVTGKLLLKTAKSVRPSTAKWFESARNYALYANQCGLYDDVSAYLGLKK